MRLLRGEVCLRYGLADMVEKLYLISLIIGFMNMALAFAASQHELPIGASREPFPHLIG